jgi:hypothetical protein
MRRRLEALGFTDSEINERVEGLQGRQQLIRDAVRAGEESAHLRFDGRPRASYPTWHAAKAAIDATRGPRRRPYKCVVCGDWHVGGRTPRPPS